MKQKSPSPKNRARRIKSVPLSMPARRDMPGDPNELDPFVEAFDADDALWNLMQRIERGDLIQARAL